MTIFRTRYLLPFVCCLLQLDATYAENDAQKATFGDDVVFLKKHTDAIVLRNKEAAVVVVPDYQGRVMTATAEGDQGPSTGWINYDLVAKGILPEQERTGLQQHIHAFGGEERLWLGPEGGQYGIYFSPGADFEFDSWKTPAPIDTMPWRVVSRSETQVTVAAEFSVKNWKGRVFDLGLKRSVRLLDRDEIGKTLGIELPSEIKAVGYETDNEITNLGQDKWTKDSGLLSLWILGMYRPSPETIVFIPYKEGSESELGPVVNDAYFGPVSSDRLKVLDGMVLFRADGKSRGKIGLSPKRSLGLAGSYDPNAERITLIQYPQPKDGTVDYVNSLWEIQDNPYNGDAINSYNDGSVEPDGEQMGPFYELESSSPALELAPGQKTVHLQRTYHLYGTEVELALIFQELTNENIEVIQDAFNEVVKP